MDQLLPYQETSEPGVFCARMTRRGRSRAIAATRRLKHRGRRLVALIAAIAVPAFAAQPAWETAAPAQTAQMPAAMAFERPGDSFPGSAFYYLADTPYAPISAEQVDLAPLAHWDDETPKPRARPLIARGTATDNLRALDCLSMAVYYEAASESDAGQRAVAQVVLNRVAHPTYPNSVCGVVFQGSSRSTGCQFTFTCDGSLARKPSRMAWDRARNVAQAALGGAVYAPIGLATHYHTLAVHPRWASSLQTVGTIGAHIFYTWKGAAGRPSAFNAAYIGGEPAPVRHKVDPETPASLDPVMLARAYEQGLAKAAQTSPQPAPSYTPEIRARGGERLYSGENLPSGGSVKAEYAASGQWIGQTDAGRSN